MPDSGAMAQEGGAGRRTLDLVFVVDCSGSMAGERIGSLNYAVRSAIPAMQAAAEEHPEVDITVRVLRFGDLVDWRVAAPVPVKDFVWTHAEAGGETSMGAAFRALASSLDASAGEAGLALPAVIVLLSDGYATDDAEAGLVVLLASEAGARAVRIPIAIGQDADLDLLQAFIGDPVLSPLRAANAEMLVSRVRWAASVPLDEVSKGAPAPLAALADRAPEPGIGTAARAAGGDLLW